MARNQTANQQQMSEEQFRTIVRTEILNFMTDNLNAPRPAPTTGKTAQASKPKLQEKIQEGEPEAEEKPLGPDVVAIGDVVENRFKISSIVPTGGFGQVFHAVDTTSKAEVDVHMEKPPMSEYIDVQILTQLQGKRHFPVLLSSGETKTYAFMVTRAVGRNLSEIRHACLLKPARLSVSAAYRCAVQCIQALESLHNIGYIHRDPKPSNFAVGKETSDQGTIYLIDFGLCRKFVDEKGSITPARDNVGFRGTVRYASLAAHESKELGRRDDLWSMYYSFVELITGQLPWRKTNEKKVVAKLKTMYSPEVLSKAFPAEVSEFVSQVQRMKFADKPDYASLSACLTKLLAQNHTKMDDPYDWQVSDCSTLPHWTPPPE